MKKLALKLLCAGALVSLAGCASLSKAECEVGDWYTLGKTDGYNGAPVVSKIASYNEACNEHGIAVNQPLYSQGHAEGLLGYCTLARGVSEGQAGRPYHGVCVGQSDVEFRQGHSVGTESFGLTDRISTLRREISTAQANQRKVKPYSADYYRLDGDIRVKQSEINTLSVQQGQIQQRIQALLSGS